MKTKAVAVAQMCSGKNKAENLDRCEWIINDAVQAGAQLVCLPENFAFLGEAETDARDAAEPLNGPSIERLKKAAKKIGVWLSLGGFQEAIADHEKIYNSHVVINDEGGVVAIYRKLHLFSVRLPDGSIYDEAHSVEPGSEVVSVAAPFARLGLSICYDVRFPKLYHALRDQGAELILVPAAFSSVTGPVHWEVLLRARAIETQSYVLAAAQYGKHNPRRVTHGFAMIIDPWGTILAQCGISSHYAIAEINRDWIHTLREDMPIWRQRTPVLL